MPIKFNGTTVNNIQYKGKTFSMIICNNTLVHAIPASSGDNYIRFDSATPVCIWEFTPTSTGLYNFVFSCNDGNDFDGDFVDTAASLWSVNGTCLTDDDDNGDYYGHEYQPYFTYNCTAGVTYYIQLSHYRDYDSWYPKTLTTVTTLEPGEYQVKIWK